MPKVVCLRPHFGIRFWIKQLNKEFTEYNERQSKTRTGENVNNIRKPRMYATYNVAIYKKCRTNTDRRRTKLFLCAAMLRRRHKKPENFSHPDDPFYLSVVTNRCEVTWLFNVTINDISVISMTAHRCAGGLKRTLDLRSGSQRHRHFAGFFNVPVQTPTRDQPFYTVIPTHRTISRLVRHAGDTEDTFST